MPTNKEEIIEINRYGAISANDEVLNNFYIFYLHLFHTLFKKNFNKMVTNYHMLNLFAMIYIHIPDGKNFRFMLSHIKEKNLSFC